jgi:putative hemolysin
MNVFESEVEPRLDLDRRRAARGFRLLAQLWLVIVAVETARGALLFVPDRLVGASCNWSFICFSKWWCARTSFPNSCSRAPPASGLRPCAPVLRAFLWCRVAAARGTDGAISLARFSDEESAENASDQEGIGALVEAAEEQGMIERDEAQMIEQVVEFSEKRMPEVMTPRPDVVVIPASSTLEQLRRLMVETKFSRVPVYGETLDDVIGIAYSRDLLQVPEQDARRRLVRELVRPALFVPETKRGSELLKEMQRKNQQMAIVVDEHGLLAGSRDGRRFDRRNRG